MTKRVSFPLSLCHSRANGNPMRILKTLEYSKKGKAHKTKTLLLLCMFFWIPAFLANIVFYKNDYTRAGMTKRGHGYDKRGGYDRGGYGYNIKKVVSILILIMLININNILIFKRI
jgi:hypothetical protein